MQVIITMAGSGQRFKKAGFKDLKPLVKVAGLPMIIHLLKIFPVDWKIILACNQDISESINDKIKSSHIKQITVMPTDRGPLDTVLQALDQSQHFFDSEMPVIVSYCDYSLIWDAQNFIETLSQANADAGIVSYKGFHPTYLGPNTYCHLKIDTQLNTVIDLQEKQLYTSDLFSEWTSCGLYFFKSIGLLRQCLGEQIAQGLKYSNGEYYTSLAIKAMMNRGLVKVINYEIKNFIQFGTPEDCERAEFWWDFFSKEKNVRFDSGTNSLPKFPFRFIARGMRPTDLSAELFEQEKNYWQIWCKLQT